LPSLTVENYVKSIFHICEGDTQRAAATGQIAAVLNVSPGTVTSMLKTLNEAGLATYTPYEGARLTHDGWKLALRILRRHRLIELFLTETLELSWDEVHNDAEQLEHVLSDFLVERIDRRLSHPNFDPHGDPIPADDGSMIVQPSQPLSVCGPGYRFRLIRVLDQTPEFLRFLTRTGLSLGVEGQVTDNLSEAGTVSVQIDDRQTTLGRQAAASLLVTDAGQGSP
jgi:DtxR family Mn-dependent transcriptional regulator